MPASVVRYHIATHFDIDQGLWRAFRYHASGKGPRAELEPQPTMQLMRRVLMAEVKRWLGPLTTLAIHLGAVENDGESVEYFRYVVSPSDDHGWYCSEQEGTPAEAGEPVWKVTDLSWVPIYGYALESALAFAELHMRQGATVVLQFQPSKLPKPPNIIKKVEFET